MTENLSSEMVRVGESDLHLLVSGSGPLLVCLHGIGGSAHSFDFQLGSLSDAFTVVAWDAPGYGRSADPPAGLQRSSYVDLVLGIADHFAAPTFNLLGMSWGAVIAAAVAGEAPSRIRALVLGSGTRGSGTSDERVRNIRNRVTELAAVGAAEFARRRAPRLLPTTADQQPIDDVAAAMAESIREAGYASAADMMASTDLTSMLDAISAPTLVIHGDLDVVTGQPESEILASGIPRSTLEVVHGAGHLVNQEQPAIFDRRVRDFLSAER